MFAPFGTLRRPNLRLALPSVQRQAYASGVRLADLEAGAYLFAREVVYNLYLLPDFE